MEGINPNRERQSKWQWHWTRFWSGNFDEIRGIVAEWKNEDYPYSPPPFIDSIHYRLIFVLHWLLLTPSPSPSPLLSRPTRAGGAVASSSSESVNEYKCLLRAQLSSKKISTVVSSKDVNKFVLAYNSLLKGNMDGLKKREKSKEKKKSSAAAAAGASSSSAAAAAVVKMDTSSSSSAAPSAAAASAASSSAAKDSSSAKTKTPKSKT